MLAFERVAHTAAARAGGLIRSRYRERPEISYKSDIDLVTAVDREAERLIVETILETFPDHGIVAEESAPREGNRAYCWYVDPLDGTTNFAHGFPHFAVSIALAQSARVVDPKLGHAEEIVLALVYDPVREETFSAVRAGGARLNGAPISVSDTATLGRSLVASGFPYDHRQRVDAYLAVWREALRRAQGVRRAGSAALDLCYVASGRFDGFWEAKLHAWDVAAGRLIVEEAGGRVTDFQGGAHSLSAEETVASNGHIHRELLDMLAAASANVPTLAPPPRS